MALRLECTKPGLRSERGFALVAVLWAVAILSLIAASMISIGTLSYRIQRNALMHVQAEKLADAGIYRAVLGLLDSRPKMRWRIDGVPESFVFAGKNISVTVQDELGLIDINAADAALLTRLVQSAGATPEQAEDIADSIISWRTPGTLHGINGASLADYRAAGYPYRPRGGPFQSVDELRLVYGMTPELFARIAPAITVYTQRPNFDPNTAPMEALSALPDLAPQQAAAMIGARTGESLSTIGDTSDAGTPELSISLAGRAFGIRITVDTGEAQVIRAAVIRLTGDPAHPYMVLDWH